MFFKIVTGYFVLLWDTSRLSREAFVALPFFSSLHCRRLYRIILNENEADFPYSDKNMASTAACALSLFLLPL